MRYPLSSKPEQSGGWHVSQRAEISSLVSSYEELSRRLVQIESDLHLARNEAPAQSLRSALALNRSLVRELEEAIRRLS